MLAAIKYSINEHCVYYLVHHRADGKIFINAIIFIRVTKHLINKVYIVFASYYILEI